MTVAPQKTYLLVKAQKAILSPQHTEAPAEVLIDQHTGKIVKIATGDNKINTPTTEDKVEVITLDESQLLMPGLIDAHGKLDRMTTLGDNNI